MDNSKEASKSAMNDLNDDIKVFVKLSSKGDNLTDKRIFFFEENRETLQLQIKQEHNIQYKYDYIFSDYDNTQLIANTLNSTITQLICNERNILFLTFGEASLGTTRFFLGYPSGNLLNKDSFFNYVNIQIMKEMKRNYPYDNILIEIYKITNEKFILDYKEIIHDSKNNIIDEINAHIKAGKKNGMTSSSIETNELLIGAGHVIIRLKFFKYSTEEDMSKSQREVEILRAFTFIDIEGFDNDFTKYVINNSKQQQQQQQQQQSNNQIKLKTNPKLHSLISFKKFIESISNQDLAKFNEVSSTLTDVLTEIFSIQNLFTFVFGFIDKYENSILESQLTLELLNKCKNINNNVFHDYLLELNISISQLGNGVIREEYQILDMIFSEVLFYLERTFLIDTQTITLDSFYKAIKDLDQSQKYSYLHNWLKKHNYDFITNKDINAIFDYVNIYYKSRARWKCLIKARDIILQLTENIKENEKTIKVERSIPIKIAHKDSYSIIKNINKNINCNSNNIDYCPNNNHNHGNNNNDNNNNNKSNDNHNNCNNKNNNKNNYQIDESEDILFLSEFPSNISSYRDMDDDFSVDGNKNYYNANAYKDDFLNKAKDNISHTGQKSTRRSVESSFSHNIFKDFQLNLKKTFKGVFNRFTEESNCIGCNAVAKSVVALDYNKRVVEYKSTSLLQTGYNMNIDDISAISKNDMTDHGKNYNGNKAHSKDYKQCQFTLNEQIMMNDGKSDNNHNSNKNDINGVLSKRINSLNSKINEIKNKFDSFN